MKFRIFAAFFLVALTPACSKPADQPASAGTADAARQATIDIKEEAGRSGNENANDMSANAPVAAASNAGDGTQAAIAVSVPKIAYVYEFGFRISAGEMSGLQRKHAELCEKQGPQVCRILEMRQSGEEGEYATGSLALAVAAPRARAFGAELTKAADDAGGKEVSSSITGEDLSKQIVDTEARLRARTLLRDRLMEVLATRKGTVAELVEAERGVAQVNEEIDEARSWLAEMRGRVDFSRVNISYASGSPEGGGFLAPIRAVVGNLGSILGVVIAGIIVLITVALPFGLLVWGIRRLWRLQKEWKLRGNPEASTEAN